MDETVRRVLITGGTGLLGAALQMSAPDGLQGFATCTKERVLSAPLSFMIMAVDLTDQAGMKRVFEQARPNLVIHTAAVGSVDFAEKNRVITQRVNVGGTQTVVDLCKEFNSRLIYISSNAVFDGDTPLYSEVALVNPINYYGQLKVDAEKIVQESGLRWAIVRSIMMYGWPYPGGRDNPVTWWIRSLEENKPIKVVNNIFSKPLTAYSCAEVVWAVARHNYNGIYHAAGRDHLSLYEFALQTAYVFELDPGLIEPVPDSFFPEIALRPKDTSFDTTKMEVELGVQPTTVQNGLMRMKSERVK